MLTTVPQGSGTSMDMACGDAMFAAMAERHAEQIADLDAESALP